MTRRFWSVGAAAIWLVGAGCEGATAGDGDREADLEVVHSALTTCKTAGTTWQNEPFAPQSGLFQVDYNVTPRAKPIDSVFGMSLGAKTAYSGFATLTRFNPSGFIDARNGGAYAATTSVPYSANVNYKFRLVVNMDQRTYSIYVTPAGQSEQTIGVGFAFRTEQQGVAQLDSWGTYAGSGSTTACGLDVFLPQTVTITPVADAHVRDGSFAGQNFGAVNPLEVKTSSAGFNRWGYLKYDLSRFGNISSARLRLTGHISGTVPPSPITTNVHAVSNTSWGESTINWNNKPALGTVLGSVGVLNADDKYYELDVTAHIKAEKAAGRNLVTLGLKNPTSMTPWNVFWSREQVYTYVQAQPELVITTTDAPVKPPVLHDTIDTFLATPAADRLYTIPVVLVRYLPTRDGTNSDPNRLVGIPTGGQAYPLSQLVTHLTGYDRQVKFMLEEGSRFRAYSNPSARPSIGYRIVDVVTFYEEVPEGPKIAIGPDPRGGSGRRLPDYTQILTRIGAKSYVDSGGVKQFWIWTYQGPHIEVNESKMASALTGDVGNSWWLENGRLPVFSKTYTVFNYNYGFGPVNAVHNHGHQREAEFSHAAWRQDGTSELFWGKFAGTPGTGRAGDCHHPPNTPTDYVYDSPTVVQSDIMDWKPQGGTQSPVNVDTWVNRTYSWPPGGPSPPPEAFWHIFWMQSYPGRGNVIQDTSNGHFMTNWWRLVADWDGAHLASFALHAPTPTSP